MKAEQCAGAPVSCQGLFPIPPAVRQITEHLPASETVLGTARQGLTDFRKIGYGGPMPPPGKPHRYFFKLYALDQLTGLKAKAQRKDVLKAIEGHVLAESELMGLFWR